jgi:hypothetical protein
MFSPLNNRPSSIATICSNDGAGTAAQQFVIKEFSCFNYDGKPRIFAGLHWHCGVLMQILDVLLVARTSWGGYLIRMADMRHWD